MARRVLAIMIFLMLVACVPGVTYREPKVTVAPDVLVLRQPSGKVLVNAALGVLAFPGSKIMTQRYVNRGSWTEFDVNASLNTVYAFFHTALIDQRWTRANFTLRGETRIEARYVGPGEDVRLLLERRARTRFRFALE